MTTDKILTEIKKERERQDKIWGGLEHDNLHNNHDWAAYIVRYLARTVTGTGYQARDGYLAIAALAVAAMEQIDRGLAKRGPE